MSDYDTAGARGVFEQVERMGMIALKNNLRALVKNAEVGTPLGDEQYHQTWYAALTSEIAKRTAEIEKRS